MKYNELLETVKKSCQETVLYEGFILKDIDDISTVISSTVSECIPVYTQDILDIVEELKLYWFPLDEIYHEIGEQTTIEDIMKSMIIEKIHEDLSGFHETLNKPYKGKTK